MRIALISYEYEGGEYSGGIGTYVRNAAYMLASRGHAVEVFTSGRKCSSSEVGSSLIVHQTAVTERSRFPEAVVEQFARRHFVMPFDVIEGPEYGADSLATARKFPDIPHVVKLHAPSFTIGASNSYYVGLLPRLRFTVGAICRGQWPKNPWAYDPLRDPERVAAMAADEIVANSAATAKRAGTEWNLPSNRMSVVPYVFRAPAELIALSPESTTVTVLFVGRLEVRKGVLELAKAIPSVLKKVPQARFRFVGRVLPHPADGLGIDRHIRKVLGDCSGSVQFVGGLPYEETLAEYARADICVFPSDWEAVGYVCLEAMAAARGVVGSSAGGMAELIDHGRTGLLVPHRNPRAIADAIIRLLTNPEDRIAMGRAARGHVLSAYSSDVIAPLQEASYLRAMERAKARRAVA